MACETREHLLDVAHARIRRGDTWAELIAALITAAATDITRTVRR